MTHFESKDLSPGFLDRWLIYGFPLWEKVMSSTPPEVGKNAGILALGGADETHRRDNWDGGGDWIWIFGSRGLVFFKIQVNKEKHVPHHSGGKSIYDIGIYILYIVYIYIYILYKCIDEIDQIWGNADTISFREGSFGFFTPCISSCGGANNMVRTAVFWLRGFIVDFMYLFLVSRFLRKGRTEEEPEDRIISFWFCVEKLTCVEFFCVLTQSVKTSFFPNEKKQYNTHTHWKRDTPRAWRRKLQLTCRHWNDLSSTATISLILYQ